MTTVNALINATLKTKRNVSLEISGSKGMTTLKVGTFQGADGKVHHAAEFYFYTDEIKSVQALLNEYIAAITADNLVKGIILE